MGQAGRGHGATFRSPRGSATAAEIASNTSSHSPLTRWRNSRMVGYQGPSARSSSQHQSGPALERNQHRAPQGAGQVGVPERRPGAGSRHPILSDRLPVVERACHGPIPPRNGPTLCPARRNGAVPGFSGGPGAASQGRERSRFASCGPCRGRKTLEHWKISRIFSTIILSTKRVHGSGDNRAAVPGSRTDEGRRNSP